MRLTFLLVIVLGLSAAIACGSGSGEDVTREEVLVALADNVYVPRYRSAADSADDLLSSLEQLQETPTVSTLDDARDSWRAARVAWSRTLAFDFGPTEERRSMSIVDWSPVEAEKIDQTISERESFDSEYVTEFLSSSQRGLGAIEHILFSEGDGSEHLATLTADGGKRLNFAVAVAQAIADETEGVALAWAEAGDAAASYRDEFTGHAPVSLFVNGAIAETVRSPVFLLQTVTEMQIAPVVGMNGGGTDLSGLPSLPSGQTWADIRARVESAEDVYTGGGSGHGLSSLVAQLSEDTDERMREAFTDALAAIDATTAPIDVVAFQSPAQVQAVLDRLTDVRRIFNTEVVSLLGVSVGFSDNDGDSSN